MSKTQQTVNSFYFIFIEVKSKTISHVNGNNGEIGKEKRHRRSKNDPEGRKYVCDICQKSYLSPPTLSSHRKNKHFQNEEKKNRGKPRKYVS